MTYLAGSTQQTKERSGTLIVRAARIAPRLKWPFTGTLVVAVVATAVRLAGPLFVRGGIDNGISQNDRRVILVAAGLWTGSLVFQYVLTAVSQWSIGWVGEQYLVRLRSVVFQRLLHLDMGFFSRSKSGVLVSRMTSDIEALQDFVSEGAVMALSNFLTVIGVAVALILVDWQMTVAVFVVVAVLLAISVVFQRQARRAYNLVRERIGLVLATLQEGISGVRVVQAFTQEREQASIFGRVNERHYDANMQVARAIAWYFPIVALLRVVAMAAALGIGAVRIIDGSLSVGTIVAFLLYLDWFFQPIINLSQVYNDMQSALAALGKLFTLVDEPVLIGDRDGAHDLPTPIEGTIILDAVDFSYLDDVPVLEDINMHIKPGERVAIVGETGSGKSTIAKLMVRFYDPTSGTIRIDGHDLTEVTASSRVGTIALIPQDSFLFSGTLRDNLVYGDPEASDDKIWGVLETMGIDDWIRSLPEGLDTQVRERGARFSAGERQLVSLARAFLADPAVIVLDEATSNLDPETEVAVESALRALLAGRTSVVIAHRLRSAERADRVVMLDAGRIIAKGTHDELSSTSPEYKKLVDVWKVGLA